MTDNQSGFFGGRLLIGVTGSAAEFLPPHTVGLFADRVISGESASTWPVDNHVTLASEQDVPAALPATSNILAAVPAGAAPDMLCSTILAAESAVVFFPVVTGEMWNKAAAQRSVGQIRAGGYHVIHPPWGARYDMHLGKKTVEAPAPPPPPRFAEVVREYAIAVSPPFAERGVDAVLASRREA